MYKVFSCTASSTRRAFIRIGGSALGGLSLPKRLTYRTQAVEMGRSTTDKSVVLLFLVGGPPQIVTFATQRNLPENNRCCPGEVPTRLPSVVFSSTFPKMTARADRRAIGPSFGSGAGGHKQFSVLGGKYRLKSTMGTRTASAQGGRKPRTDVPTLTVLVLGEGNRPARPHQAPGGRAGRVRG